ncbi:MAG: type 1 glutamine amidotransferase, partial [Thermoleophilia bacterium]
MRKVMVIQHIGCEPLGLFAEEAASLAEFTYVRPYRSDPVPDSLAEWDGLIILGGPMAVYESYESLYLN